LAKAKKVARVVPAKPTELDQHRQVRIPSCDWSRWRTTLALWRRLAVAASATPGGVT
jgi:hypothetical protein